MIFAIVWSGVKYQGADIEVTSHSLTFGNDHDYVECIVLWILTCAISVRVCSIWCLHYGRPDFETGLWSLGFSFASAL